MQRVKIIMLLDVRRTSILRIDGAALWYVGINIAEDSTQSVSFPEHKVIMLLRNVVALPTRLHGIISQKTTV